MKPPPSESEKILQRINSSGPEIALFAHRLAEFIKPRLRACSYSEDGPDIISDALEACHYCRSYLQDLVNQAQRDAATLSASSMQAFLRRVEFTGDMLILIHRVASAVLRSSVFTVPSPIALIIARLAKRIDSERRLVVVPLTAYDYQHQSFKLGPFGPLTGKGMSLLGLPSVHCECPFSATLLFHELGHFAAHSSGFNDKPPWHPAPAQDPELYAALHELARSRVGKRPMDVQAEMSRLHRVRDRWCQELFADHFALAIVGPVYIGAFCSLERVSPCPCGPLRGALPTHPHSRTRIRYLLRGLDPQSAAVFAQRMPQTHSAGEDMSDLPTPSDYVTLENAFRLDQSYDGVKNKARELVRAWRMVFDSNLLSGDRLSQLLDCYGELTPAGQLVTDRGTVSYPDWRAILNAGWIFLTEKRELWDKKLRHQGSELDRHCGAVDKLSALVIKSLEDVMVAKEWPEARHVSIE